jgi:tetratricopeptide (TPR) repeat protein
MRAILHATLLILAVPGPALAQAKLSAEQKADQADFRRAHEAMAAKRHDAALGILDPLIARYARRYADEKRLVFCASGPTETLGYLLQGAAAKRDTVAVDAGWCDALFLRGYVLADAGRYAEAADWIGRAIEKAPQNAHYLNELGYVYGRLGRMEESLAAFDRAVAGVPFGPEAQQTAEHTRALRGKGWVLVEQRKWDDAEAVYREALKLDPDDAKSKAELGYIADNRPRTS